MERSEAGMKKKKSREPMKSRSKYKNNKHNIVIFYKKWKKYNEIYSTITKIDLNRQKKIIVAIAYLTSWGRYSQKQYMN